MTADPFLTTAQVADLLGYTNPAAVRTAVRRGYLPPADDDGDPDVPANHRPRRWRSSTIRTAQRNRLGQGTRTDLASDPTGHRNP